MNNNEMIIVKQVPIIEQHIENMGLEIKGRIDQALAGISADTPVKELKDLRADLNKEYKELEDKRKYVKEQVSKPYEEFNKIYQEQISTPYKSADDLLKRAIDKVENDKKMAKAEVLQRYFDDVQKDRGIDFVKFIDVGLNITLSAKEDDLKAQIDTFFDKIESELTLIYTQDHKDEILYEYKQHRDITKAITTVQNRVKTLEEQKKKEEEQKAIDSHVEEQAKAVDAYIAENNTAEEVSLDNLIDVEEFRNYDVDTDSLTYERTLKIKCTQLQLNSLYDYLTLNNIEYEEE